jgi:hypothetical protein
VPDCPVPLFRAFVIRTPGDAPTNLGFAGAAPVKNGKMFHILPSLRESHKTLEQVN